jgi:hypothetical protein
VAVITVVRSPACHLCDDAGAALADLAAEYPIRVEMVDADSAGGKALVGEHRPGMFPLVLVDGAVFSQGRLPRRKLRALLNRQAVTTP